MHEVSEECMTDQDCNTTDPPFPMICAVPPPEACICNPTTLCIPGCQSAEDCRVGEMCNAENRCVVMTCNEQSPCPAHFDCVAGGAPFDRCVRRSCERDDQCPGGACVNGACHPDLGLCLPLPG